MKCEDYITLHYDVLHMNNITHYAYFDTRQCGRWDKLWWCGFVERLKMKHEEVVGRMYTDLSPVQWRT
jgi:hypothetical protein